MCISTGIVALAEANADQEFELGELAADQITGKNYADAKLKRKDKVVSICTTKNNTGDRGCQMKIKPISLFLRVTCVMRKREEMEKHLLYEFTKHPPSILEGTMMRKTTRSVLADVLKGRGVTDTRFFVFEGLN